MSTANRKFEHPAWLIMIEGILAILVGIMFLIWPVRTFTVLAFFLGIWWFIDGIFDVVSIFLNRENWVWKLIMGAIGILAGIFLIQAPLQGAIVLSKTYVLMIGIMGVLYGVMGIVGALRGAGVGAGIIGVISVILGLFMLMNSWSATLVVPTVFGILSIVGGIGAVLFAFQRK